jgi:ABC-2 type transport system permease protein
MSEHEATRITSGITHRGRRVRTFLALLRRDGHVARRNFPQMLVQNLLQPMMFVFIFGRVMTQSGFLPVEYKSLLLPGIMALSMMISGIQAVALTLIAEFQFTREIEDRLLAPIRIEWVAIEKVAAGMIQALVAGLVVIPIGFLLMGSGLDLSLDRAVLFGLIALLVAGFAGATGLILGSTVSQMQIGLMFTLVVAPLIFFGCVYYPWTALAEFPILQKVVLFNPLVYASEGLRAVLTPQFDHLSLVAVIGALVACDVLLLLLGLNRFRAKAVS